MIYQLQNNRLPKDGIIQLNTCQMSHVSNKRGVIVNDSGASILLYALFILFTLITSVSCASAQQIVQKANEPNNVWGSKLLTTIPKYKFISDDTACVKELIYEGVGYANLPKTEVFAYYATPGTINHNASLDKNLPAIVFVHGGGGKAFREFAFLWAQRGYAVIAMDLAGNGKDGKRLPLGGPDQDPRKKFTNIDSVLNQQWVYHAVYNVALAHSLLLSFKEVDKNNTGITGISWGGFLTCISAGLDNRYKAAVPVYGCGFYFDTAGVNYRANLNKLSKSSAERWIQQYDPSNFIGQSKAKFLWITGAKDQHFNPSMFSRTYNEVVSQSIFRLIPDMPHGHYEGAAPTEIAAFMNHYLKNDHYQLPFFESVNNNSSNIRAIVNTKETITAATLCFTKDKTLPFEKRVWETLPANVDGKKVTAQLPDGVVMWMINIKDSKGMLVSSKYYFQ